jgi:hypothetical protein
MIICRTKGGNVYMYMIFCVPGGMMFGIMYAVYGLGFWYGIKLIMDDRSIYTSYLFTVGTYI